MNMTPALASYLARDYDAAVQQLQKIIEMEPNFPAAHSVLGNVYVQQGLFEQAMAEYQKVLELFKRRGAGRDGNESHHCSCLRQIRETKQSD